MPDNRHRPSGRSVLLGAGVLGALAIVLATISASHGGSGFLFAMAGVYAAGAISLGVVGFRRL